MIKRLLVCLLLGIVIGGGLAVALVRQGLSELALSNGPWVTGRDLGSVDADAATRAVVALRGLLALPESEALYFNAAVDSAGEPLDGRCRYTVQGSALPTRWWSLTGYDSDGNLIANPGDAYSVGSSAVADGADWQIAVGPQDSAPAGSAWISTGGLERFELTLRAYHPDPVLLADRGTIALPVIRKQGCQS